MSQIANKVYIYQTRKDDGTMVNYLSPLKPDEAFSEGLPAQAVMGEVPATDSELDAGAFKQNKIFLAFLNGVIANHATQCPGLQAEIERQQDGYVYIIDRRTPTPGGEVPPEDIIGAVKIEKGQLLSYHGSPNYRTFTGAGFMQLDPWLHERLMEELRRIVAAKKG
ncbi:MAG: hypothetical protein GC159_18860 [Phycisphaera sp.]|nr:hypothetical protein [Phycisphaera sp.]